MQSRPLWMRSVPTRMYLSRAQTPGSAATEPWVVSAQNLGMRRVATSGVREPVHGHPHTEVREADDRR